jgi:hypothetical protein
LRERIKRRIMAGSKGGKPGQWSARKAQLVAQEYRKAGGGYKGGKSTGQRSLSKWSGQKWTTSDGKPAIRKGGTTRYLPEKAWKKLTPAQRAATNRKKREGSRSGRQFVRNTEAAARAGATARKSAEQFSTALKSLSDDQFDLLFPEGRDSVSLLEMNEKWIFDVGTAFLRRALTNRRRKRKRRRWFKQGQENGVEQKAEKKPLRDPKGGLTAAGRAHFKRTEGANLKPGVKGPADTPEKMRRKGSFLTRFFTNPSGPMVGENGKPTRLALSAAAWGEPVPKNRSDAAKLAAKGRRLLERYENTKKNKK